MPLDLAKYVAVGVLAVIVLAAVTYDGEGAAVEPEVAMTGGFGADGELVQPSVDSGTVLADPQPVSEGDYLELPAPVGAEVAVEPEIPAAPVSATPQPQPQPRAQPSTSVPASAPRATSGGEVISHTLQRGETLSDAAHIMLGNRGRWRELHEYNRDKISDPNHVRAGMTLTFPRARLTSSTPTRSLPEGRRYRVTRGDTLYSIARRELGNGTRWREIAELNQIGPDDLRYGKEIVLPR